MLLRCAATLLACFPSGLVWGLQDLLQAMVSMLHHKPTFEFAAAPQQF